MWSDRTGALKQTSKKLCFSERHHGVFLPKVLTWAKQHQQRLETALSELVANAELLEELLAWIQWAETTLIQRDQEPIPQNIDRVKALITEHQVPASLCPVCVLGHMPFTRGSPLSLLQNCCIITAEVAASSSSEYQFSWVRNQGMGQHLQVSSCRNHNSVLCIVFLKPLAEIVQSLRKWSVKQRQANFWVQGQPGLQSEFQDSQGYTEKPCLGEKKKKKWWSITQGTAIHSFTGRSLEAWPLLDPKAYWPDIILSQQQEIKWENS
jgi:hypothetical protein